MSVVSPAGLGNDVARTENSAKPTMRTRSNGNSWANVQPLDRPAAQVAAGAVGEWVDLLARISHDLRTPLNAVIGFSDVMQQELFGPLGHTRYQEYVRHIRASGMEVLQAAEDALTMTALLAEPKAVTFEHVNLAQALGEAIDDLSGRLRLQAPTIEIEIADELDVRSDRRILTRALRQLVTIGLARAGQGAMINVSAVCEHGLVQLRVDVSDCHGACPVNAEQAADLGMGRRDLGVWIATSMLDLIDCRLAIETDGERLALTTTLEQANQPSFFQRIVA